MNLSWRIRIPMAIANILIFGWLGTFLMLEWDAYTWSWSDNKAFLALQYWANGLWFSSGLVCLVATIPGTIFILTNGFQIDGYDIQDR